MIDSNWPYKSRIGPKQGKIWFSRSVSSITAFLYMNTNIINFISSLNLEFLPKGKLSDPIGLKLDLIRADWGPNKGKTWFSQAGNSIT